MSLSEEATERLADVVALQPTKNADLQEKWGMDSGSEVHQYLESELGEYYYRDENSMICATPEAEALVGGGDASGERSVTGTALQKEIIAILPGPDEDPQSVVATLHDIEDTGTDTSVDEVRSALHTLTDKGLVERVRKTVPTFRLAIDRDRIVIETGED
ncbi:DUF5797 family protein [Halovenus halobia]|uniref:DUF5797 family protein n=1 Tax=Halovenus halobia TaxID=3396622 RepID=UPI003F544115